MAYTIADGLLGLEGIHRIGTLDFHYQDTLPRIECERMIGLHALPEADDNREPAYGQIGERIYPSLARGKTITYEGTVYGRTLSELRTLMNQLRGLAGTYRSVEAPINVRPHADIGGTEWVYYARVMALDADDEQLLGPEAMPTAFQRPFILTLRQSNPRAYAVSDLISDGGTSGAVVSVTNAGTAPTDPIFDIEDLTDGTIELIRSAPGGATLTFGDDLELEAGESLEVDFGQRRMRRLPDGADFTHKMLFEDSNWWDALVGGIEPGENALTVVGGTWTVRFNPASW